MGLDVPERVAVDLAGLRVREPDESARDRDSRRGAADVHPGDRARRGVDAEQLAGIRHRHPEKARSGGNVERPAGRESERRRGRCERSSVEAEQRSRSNLQRPEVAPECDDVVDGTVESAADEHAAALPVDGHQSPASELGLTGVPDRRNHPVPDTREVGRLSADDSRLLDRSGAEIEAEQRPLADGASALAVERQPERIPAGSEPAGVAWDLQGRGHPFPRDALAGASCRQDARADDRGEQRTAHDRDSEARALCHELMIPPFRASSVDSRENPETERHQL